MNVIGITGTNGKTSIAQILYQILLRLKKSCGALGTLGFQTPTGMLSKAVSPTTQTVPASGASIPDSSGLRDA